MTKVKVRHYVVKRGKGFWQPTTKMKSLGFGPVPCGPDGPGAWALAEEWNRRWDQTRSGEVPSPAMASAQNLSFENSEELTIYPPRSLGDTFRRYRRTEEWKRKAPRTREDWWRGWKRIKPIFGDVDPRTVRLDDISAWRKTRHPHLYAVALSSRLATHQRSCKTVLLRGGANDEGQGSPLRRETRQGFLATDHENEISRFRSGAVRA